MLSIKHLNNDKISENARATSIALFQSSLSITISPLILLFCLNLPSEKRSVLRYVWPTSGRRSKHLRRELRALRYVITNYTTFRGGKQHHTVVRRIMDGYRFCLGLLDVWLPSDNYSWNCLSRRAVIIDTHGTIDMRRHSRV